MPKEKVTLSLDTARLKELRDLVGSRSISAAERVEVYSVDTRAGVRAGYLLGRVGAGSELAVDAFVVAVADLEGGAVVASGDVSDMERLAAHAAKVVIADVARVLFTLRATSALDRRVSLRARGASSPAARDRR